MRSLPEGRLARIFSTLLAPLLVGSGCGIDESQFTFDLCDDSNNLDLVSSVVPAMSVDYLDLRSVAEVEIDGPPSILDAVGMICAGAADAAACQAAFAALPNDGGLSITYADHNELRRLAYTRGDEVGSLATRDELSAFLGEIDGPGDAGLTVMFAGNEHHLNCSAGAEAGAHEEGFVIYTTSGTGCGRGDDREHHVVLVRADGSTEVLQTELIERGKAGCAIGRLPPGLCPRRGAPSPSPVGRFLADVAHLEAAAAPAFAQLAGELALHGAPAPMIRRAVMAREDERRHARITAALARRHGGRPQAPRLRPAPPRSLVEVASDNAIEGCVRETYGALVAALQARRARDPVIRRALAGIARDEARHAALSWALAGWAAAKMSPAERREVARRRADAEPALARELTAEVHPQVRAVVGMPGGDEAQALYRGLQRALASALA